MIKNRTTRHLVMAGSTLLSMAGVTAQAQSPDAGFTLEEITITATKRETSLQDTPISVAAISGEDIQKSGRTTLAQILADVSGVEANTAGNFGTYFWVRGIGSSPTFGQDAAVTMSVNGVFQQSAQSTRGTFYDIDRVEVARGPQSTLQGRNSLGGSITVVTAEPKMTYESEGTIGIGDHNLFNAQGMLNMPLNEVMALRGSFSTEKRDGWLSNGNSDSDTLAGRLRYMIKPSDDLKLIFSAEVSKTGGAGVGSAVTGLYVPNQVNEIPLGRYCRNVDECAGAIVAGGMSTAPGATFNNLPQLNNFYTSFDAASPYSRKFKSSTYYMDLNWNLGFANLYLQPTFVHTNIVDYNQNFSMLSYVTWSEAVNRLQPGWSIERREQLAQGLSTSLNWNHLVQDQKTFELRVSSPDENKLQWLGGLYYFENKEKVRVSVTAGGMAGVYTAGAPTPYCITPSTVTAALPFGGGCTLTSIPTDASAVIRDIYTDPSLANIFDIRSGIDPNRYARDYAAYGQVVYPFTDDLKLTVGGRYTKEKKWRAAEPNRSFYNANDNSPGTTGIAISGPLEAFQVSWNIFDYRATLDYHFTPDNMVYGSISTGFRGGAFQNFPPGAFQGTYVNAGVTTPWTAVSTPIPGFRNYYDPEKITSFEVGTRNDLLNKRLRLNASAYFYDYKDYQYSYAAFLYADQDPQSTVTYITNAGKATAYGADIESHYVVTNNDELGLNVSYNKTKLGAFSLFGADATSVTTAALLKGTPLRRSPEWTVIPNYRHRFDMGTAGVVTAGADAHWESESYINAPTTDAVTNKFIKQKSYAKYNASLSYDTQDGRFNMTAAVRNISDEVTFGTLMGTPSTATAGNVQSTSLDPSEPRTYTVTLSAKFQ
ncbi:MAG: TonB-dependent receptor [Steroidobacteraceae bacterium]